MYAQLSQARIAFNKTSAIARKSGKDIERLEPQLAEAREKHQTATKEVAEKERLFNEVSGK